VEALELVGRLVRK